MRTNVKYRCVSFLGVKLWNGPSDELKLCRSLLSFKTTLKGRIIKDYNVKCLKCEMVKKKNLE